MHRLARLSEDERGRLIGDFLDTAFGVQEADPRFAGIRRSMTPELPDDPETGQVEAWVELAELSQDPDFRARMRLMAEQHAADRAPDGPPAVRRDAVAMVRDRVVSALAAGIDPGSPEAGPVVAAVTAQYAHTCGGRGDAERRLPARLETANDPRREWYLRLLSLVNGWPRPDDLTPALDWFARALHAHRPRLGTAQAGMGPSGSGLGM